MPLRSQSSLTSISIHALLAESDDCRRTINRSLKSISIHALLAESDGTVAGRAGRNGYFYPRSPCGERLVGLAVHRLGDISIHALLAESDADDGDAGNGCDANFYPRSPCGERPLTAVAAKSPIDIFLSTLSLRRATGTTCIAAPTKIFLSTLSLRRATPRCAGRHPLRLHFYPRSPCGERQKMRVIVRDLIYISIHALLAESDSRSSPKTCRWQHFYPRSPCGERRLL